MRLRSQFVVLASVAGIVGVIALVTLTWSAREASRVALEQELATTTAREVTGLLVLTQDYLLYGEPRARQQWLARYQLLAQANAASLAVEMKREHSQTPGDDVASLSETFAQLTDMSNVSGGSALQARRRELLVDRLLTGAETIAENAYQRERASTLRRNAAEQRLMWLALVLPSLLALVFGLLGWHLSRQVLSPLTRLSRSMDAVAAGRLSARAGSNAKDELGDLSRRFDQMAAQLEERDAALRSSEAMLRLVTDNLPAMIGYWDRNLTNRFANADYRRWFGKSPEEIRGRRLADLLGPDLFQKNKPFIDAALAGQRQDFARSIPGPDGVVRHSQAAYIPDEHQGRVDGFFVLVTDVTERVNSEQKLARALEEKETLLKEVYHRVKNNLQVVQSLLSLQGRNVRDDSARAALQDMALRVRSMALVHEQLYGSSSLRGVSLPAYVGALADQLTMGSGRSTSEVRVTVEAPTLDVSMDVAIPLGLLLTELVSNSFKHGFPDGRRGCIKVLFESDPSGLRISVADDGVGLPPGLDPSSTRSMGLQLATSLARQLGGELHFRSGPGTTVWLVVPHLLNEEDHHEH
ncbi:sensor histidine kinase [Ideonella sp.]|uniref:sensor histidine kinase n=1 Tax=Ideonella sp. TaxID=1929293 RepID=UPI0035B3A751